MIILHATATSSSCRTSTPLIISHAHNCPSLVQTAHLLCTVPAPATLMSLQVAGTLERVRTAELQCPACVGPQAADLLQRLLVKDPTKRLTLDAALRHPFVLQRRGGLSSFRSRLGLLGGSPGRGKGRGRAAPGKVHVLQWDKDNV